MKGSQIIITALEQENVEVVFGYPGGAVLPLYDAFYHSKLRHILTRHEQGAAHAADGYARSSGKPGVVFATSGPGATNLVTGIANAQMDSVPMVLITGQVVTRLIGTDAFQEADITGITLPITKHNYLVKNAGDLSRVIAEAFHLATTGRPGPVLIDIPKDVFEQEAEFSYQKTPDITGYKPTYEGHQGQVSRAARAIAAAKKPVVFAGGGIIRSGAYRELQELVERGQIPITLSLMGLGAFPGSDSLFLGMAGMHGTVAANYALMEADLILAAGVRFDDRVTGKLESFAPGAKIIHIDIDPAEIGKNVAVDIPIVGDLKRVLASLLARFKSPETGTWVRQVQEWCNRYPLSVREEEPESKIKPQYVIKEIYRLTGGEAIIATDVGQHQMWTAQHYRFDRPRTFLTSGGLGTMGYGLPAALGAATASPGRDVWCIAGDGGIQMNIQELVTAVNYCLPVKIAIMNNGYLGMVRQWQEMFYEGRYACTELAGNPDFVKVAEAFGATGLRATRCSEVAAVLETAADTRGPVLIDFQIDREENVYPMVAPNYPLSEIILEGKGRGK